MLYALRIGPSFKKDARERQDIGKHYFLPQIGGTAFLNAKGLHAVIFWW